MARVGGRNRRMAARVALVGVVAGVASLGVAGPASAQATAGPVAVSGSPSSATVQEHSLGPISTAAIGGVLVAGVLWLRARQRDRVPA